MKVSGPTLVAILAGLVALAEATDQEHLFNYWCKADAECRSSGIDRETKTMGECADKCNDRKSDCKWFEWSPKENCKLFSSSSGSYSTAGNHLCCQKRYEVDRDGVATSSTSVINRVGFDSGVSNSIVDKLENQGRFSTLSIAIIEADLRDALDSNGPFTIFAPTNSAFRDLPFGTLDYLLDDRPVLREVLEFHVLGQKVTSFSNGVTSFNTLLGNTITVKRKCVREAPCRNWSACWGDRCEEYQTFVDGVRITESINAKNGIIHVVGSVLDP